MINTLEILKAELAAAGALLRAAFPEGIRAGDKLMDAAEYASELCGRVHRKGRWPTVEEVCAGITNAGGYLLTAKGWPQGTTGNIPARLIWTDPDTN